MNRKVPSKLRAVELDTRFLEIEPYDLGQFQLLLRYEPPASRIIRQADKGAQLSKLGPRPAFLASQPARKVWPELIGGLSLPLANANAIADQCAQLGYMRATGGLTSEPVWHACIGVLAFCENGERLAHDWSKGDQRYNPRETQGKFDRCRALAGATLCARFQDMDNETRARCEACPHKGKINSPIMSGTRGADLGLHESATLVKKPAGAQRAAVHQWERTKDFFQPGFPGPVFPRVGSGGMNRRAANEMRSMV
jgi:hypothetical protein